MYAGLSPPQALALYSVISYLDCVRGGVPSERRGARGARRAWRGRRPTHGVESATCRDGGARSSRRSPRNGGRDGRRGADPADAVVVNADLPVAYRDLLGIEPRRCGTARSCFVLLAGSTASYSRIAHHNIHFGRSWSGVFPTSSSAPGRSRTRASWSATPTAIGPVPAPPGRQIYSVLLPDAESDDPTRLARTAARPTATTWCWRALGAGVRGFADASRSSTCPTPPTGRRAAWSAEPPFGTAHTFGQTGPFRPGNRWGENVVFAGSGTRPGVGVPMALISGRLAAERIVGPVPLSHSRACRDTGMARCRGGTLKHG